MAELFFWCAAVGGGLLVLQFLLQLIGADDSAASDLDFEVDADLDGAHGAFLQFLSLQALTAFATFFGLGGMFLQSTDQSPTIAAVGAAVSGALAMWAITKAMQAMRKLQASGTIDLQGAMGSSCRVYLKVPARGQGEGRVTIALQGRSVELKARSDGPELLTGSTATVTGVEGDTLLVSPLADQPDNQRSPTMLAFVPLPLLPAMPQGLDSDTILMLSVAAAVVFALGLLLVLVKRYKRCPSNKILVIYGRVKRGESARCVHGGGTFVLPLIQDYSYLSLDPMQIEIPLRGALSAENIRVNVPSVFTVAIGTEPIVMQTAAVRLLGLDTRQIMKQAEDIILGQLRQVIASMTIEDINRDRDKFLGNVQSSLTPELEKIGLVLINVNITDITDESGYIEAMGRKAASEAIQQAEIDVAVQQKHGAIGVAEAKREQDVNVALADKVREIGTREADRDKAVRLAELQKETQIGESLATFLQQAEIKEQEQSMRIQVAEADALAVTGENLAKGRVADADADLKVKQAEAFQLAETRRREAEAAVHEAQYIAEARAGEAMAKKIEQEQRAELEARAKAVKAKLIVDAEASAEQVRLAAEAEANATFARLEAQARGEYEILAKKAEGLERIVEGCGGPQYAFQMLMLEQLPQLAETAAKAIANVKFDKVVVWDGGAGADGKSATAGFLQSMAKSLPPMMHMLQDIGGVKMPEFFGQLQQDEMLPDGVNAKAAAAATAAKAAAVKSGGAKPKDGPPPKPNDGARGLPRS